MITVFVLLALLLLALIGVSYWISSLLLYSRRQPICQTPATYGMAYEEITFRNPAVFSPLVLGWRPVV